MSFAAAILIFIVTIVLVIRQPKGLGIGWSALGGALAALIFQIVSLEDIITVTGIVWNATLAFVAIIIVSVIMDEIGFFEWSALHMARLARGNGLKLFIFTTLLGAIVSAFFTNDGTALILTPIVLAQIRAMDIPLNKAIPFVMAGGFIADTTSLPLTISNLVNIVSADYFDIGFVQYAARMIIPNMFSIGASLAVLLWYYRKHIPQTYDSHMLKKPSEAIKHTGLFRWSWVILAVMMLGFLFSEALAIPVSAIIGTAAVLFLVAASSTGLIQTKKTVREAPWSVVFFSIGMYVVVYGLRNVGLTDILSTWIESFAHNGLFIATISMGFLSALLSSVMNNLPSVMVGALSIQDTDTTGLIREGLIYANVIGCDLGPKITPIGSLATLLWLHVLKKKGIAITWGAYFRTGIVLTVPTLLITLLGLYLWLLVS
jgi:arsenical pump membrane protein